MQKTYTPKSCEGDKAKFKGDVVLKLPSYDERLDLMIESGLMEAMQGQDVSNPEQIAKNSVYLRALSKTVKLSYPYYVKVNITRKSDKKVYKSLDDLKYDPDASSIVQEVAMELATGTTLGKS